MNSYTLTPDQQKFIREKVAKNGRTLIYNYMTGVIDGTQIGLSNTEKFSGVELTLQEETQPQTVQYLTPASEYTFKGVVEPFAIVTDPKAKPLAIPKKWYSHANSFPPTRPSMRHCQSMEPMSSVNCSARQDATFITI